MDVDFEILSVVFLLIAFKIVLPTVDTYSDASLSYSLLTGTYQPYGDNTAKPQLKYGSIMLIPIILTTLFTIPHWYRRENSIKKRLITFPILIFQLWPQWQVIKVLKLMRNGDSKWRIEKQKLEKEVSFIGKFSASCPLPHLCLLPISRHSALPYFNFNFQCFLLANFLRS